MWSTKRKPEDVYKKAEWRRRLDEKDKALAKAVFELWMAGVIDLELWDPHRASNSQKGVQLSTPFGRQNPVTSRMIYDAGADDRAHKHEKWEAGFKSRGDHAK